MNKLTIADGAVVMGGADSTGLAVALRLADFGAKVHIGDIREDVLGTALTSHPRLSGSRVDAANASEVTALFERARESGDVRGEIAIAVAALAPGD